jgi:hypothetical protein
MAEAGATYKEVHCGALEALRKGDDIVCNSSREHGTYRELLANRKVLIRRVAK